MLRSSFKTKSSYRTRLPIVAVAMIGLCRCSATAATIDSFSLPNMQEQAVEIQPSPQFQLTVVCFLGTECPLAKLYASRLNEISSEYVGRGVRLIAINSNQQDSLANCREYVSKHQLAFPLLKDFRNVVADRFEAERTPEAFVLDSDFRIRYRGRIDDQYTPGVSQPKASRSDLRIALDQLLAGEEVGTPRTEAPGCFIGRVREPVADSEVTYCNQIARVLQKHCVECHRTDEIGPFQLTDYEEVVGWADTILEVIDDGRMPPWHADPDHGEFTNARQMPEADKLALKQWVAAGLPFGDAKQLPEPPDFTSGWRLPVEPDIVLAMGDNTFSVPAEGTVDYQYFVVDPKFTEDKWITAAEVQPGNRSVVHHSIVFVRPPDGARFRGLGWVAAYVPGQQVTGFPPKSGLLVPAGSKFVFQQHYTPTGSPQEDRTKVGFVFGDEAEITDEIYTIVGIDQEFEIPPGSPNHIVKSRIRWLPKNGTLLSINPHMHLRGKSFRLYAEVGEEKETMLDVPRYDFNWQHSYRLRDPLPLDAIDGLAFEAVFDNSADNPVNPDPDRYVTWGDQTWEEMAVVFFEVSEPRKMLDLHAQNVTANSESDETRKPSILEKEVDQIPAAIQQRMTAEADRMLERFDADGNGKVGKYETPWVFRRYTFYQIDHDGDGQLTRKEIENSARWRVSQGR